MRGRLTALMVVALVAGAALPAGAADHSTDLVSVGPASASVFQVGEDVVVPYVADTHGQKVAGVALSYSDGFGGESWIQAWRDDSEGSAPPQVTETVTSDWRPGNYTLESVALILDDWTEVSFLRDGTTEEWGEEQATGTHHADLSAADFSVVNDGADLIAPVLESFTVDGRTKHYRDQIDISYEASDESGIDFVYFQFVDPRGTEHWVTDSDGWDEETGDEVDVDGVASTAVDLNWASGRSELVSIGLFDDAGDNGYNVTYYKSDGETYTYPEKVQGPGPHSFDLGAAPLQIDNADFDIDAPVLSSLSRTTPDVQHPGEELGIAYLADDPHFEGIHLNYTGTEEGAWLFADAHDVPAAGEFKSTLWDEYGTGGFALDDVMVHDSGVGYAWLYRDGTMDSSQGETHNLDFSALDFTIEPWPHTFEDALTSYGVSLAPAEGKVRADLGGNPWVQAGVEFSSTGADGWAVRYADTDFSIVGTFDTATGDFFAVVRRGITTSVLTNDPR